MQTIVYTYGEYHKVCTVTMGKRKSISIVVTPHMEIIIKTPMDCPYDKIQSLIHKRQHWIYKQLRTFEKFHPLTPSRHYISGETHLYLGRQYRLKIIPYTKQPVKLKGGYFWIPADSSEQAKKKLNNWYLSHAKQTFAKRLHICLQKHPYFTKPCLNIRHMKTRWGSLSQNGIMTLNTDLIKASADCIDYVIIHELCHQYHMNHRAEFWKMLETLHPNWQHTKHKLETMLS